MLFLIPAYEPDDRMIRLATGIFVHDTQTGLRGLLADTLPFALDVDGDRFEYEMNCLLRASRAGIALQEVPIDTVYAATHSSHFHTFRDSFRVYARILRFVASSLTAAALDFALLFVLNTLTGNLLVSVVAARIASASANYAMNRALVFQTGRECPAARSLPRYAAFATVLLVLNYGCLYALTVFAGIPLLPAKLLTEGILYMLSYWSQRRFVFARSAPTAPAAPNPKPVPAGQVR
jgi:putative flippase GtrA